MAQGLAHSTFEVINRSLQATTGMRGVIGIQGPTEMGTVSTPVAVGSWDEYLRAFGGYNVASDFPLYVKRLLDGGARLYVSRVARYSNIDDPATLVGQLAKATAGADNDYAEFVADNIGEWANGVVITVTASGSGIAGNVDIAIAHPGNSTRNYTHRNLPAELTEEARAAFNADSPYVKIAGFEGELPVGVVTLAGGVYDVSTIADLHYTGSPVGRNGWHAFDQNTQIIALAAPGRVSKVVDAGLDAYVLNRPDLEGFVTAPAGNGTNAIAYRNGTGIHAGTSIDNWRMLMSFGQVDVLHPITGVRMKLSEISDVLACHSRRDQSDLYEFHAAAGPELGRLRGVLDVGYNVGGPATRMEADNLVLAGINPVINHPDFGPVYWGNRNLSRTYAGTQMDKANISSSIVRLYRRARPRIDLQLFKPNDIPTWRTIYRSVRELMLEMERKRAVYPNEGEGWIYQGDQNAETIADATVNKNVTNSYTFYLYVKFIGALEFVGMKVVVTDTNVDYSVVTDQPA